jgi:hypothetical protein
VPSGGLDLVRWQGTESTPRRRIRPGVFALVNGLWLDGLLSPVECEFRQHGNAWFHGHLTVPTDVHPSVYDDQLNPGAGAWFKTTAVACLERVPGYLELLDRHGIPWERVVSRRPGRIVYEDEQQVVAVPVA